jgi:hypothetical protein
MKPRSYNTPTAFRRALEDRLSTIARSENVDLQRIRRQVAFDRALATFWRRQSAMAAEGRLLARTEIA